MARVHRLEHVERLGAANLADDDPVGAHTQRVAHEIADRDVALALDVRRARLEPEHVPLVELQLGRVLDRHDALVVRDRSRQRVEQRRLARARAAGDQHVAAAPRCSGDRNSTDCSESEPMLIMSSIERRRRLNFRIVRSGPESDSGAMIALTRDAVGEARVDHRRRLVDAPADLRHDLVDDAAQVRLVREADGRLVELAAALDPDVVRAVAHDLGDRLVREQTLERPVAEDVVEDLRREPLAVLAGDAGLVVQKPAHVRGHAVAELVRDRRRR